MNRRPRFSTLFVALVYFATAAFSLAAPGDLDSSFSGDGRTRIAFGRGSGGGRDVAVDANGRILVAGTASSGGDSSFAVARYLPDGSFDSSFGDSGVAITNMGIASPNISFSGEEEGRAIALQSDGKIVVAGYVQYTTNADFAVVRYNADGSLDSSFGAGGISTSDFAGATDFGTDVAIQGDGKVVVAGISNGYFAVARFNPDGSADQSFGVGGQKVADGIIGDSVDTAAMTLQSDGKILVAGSPSAGNSLAFYILRLTQNGAYDATFGSGGLVGRASLAGGGGHCTSIVMQLGSDSISSPDRIVAAGYTYDGSREVFVVMRFNLNGSLDTSLDGDGEVDTDLSGVSGGSSRAAAVKIENGSLAGTRKIVVAGSVTRPSGGGSDSVVVHYNSNGTFDTTFDGDGVGVYNPSAFPVALALSSGKILFVGGNQGRFETTRVNSSNGLLDTTFDQDGLRVDEIGGARSVAGGVAVQSDGKIVVTGSGGGVFGTNRAVARLNADGTLDLSFEGDGKAVGTEFADAGGTAVALQPDGKILVAGARSVGTNNVDAIVTRYNPNGSIDTSFAGGFASSQYPQANDYANAMVRLNDGRIVIAGYVVFGTNRDVEIVRFNENGTLDNTFDFDGKVVTALGSGLDEFRGIAVQADGKIVAAGYATNGPRQLLVARFNENGSLDPTFDQDGVVFTNIGPGDAVANAIAIDKSGRILAAGFSSNGTNYDVTVARYLSDGSLDPSFGNGGMVVTPITSGDDVGNAIAIQPDGKIVVAGGVNPNAALGFSTTDFALVRYLENGTLDSNYGVGGKVVFGFSAQTNEAAYAIALDANANALVAGESDQLFGVARVLAGPLLTPARLANISTRLLVQTGDNVLFGGFIVTGTQPKKVIVRALGPSVAVTDALANPTLELYQGNTLAGSNDDWQNQPAADRQAVIDSTIPPSNDLESALVRTLPANGTVYTVIVRGANNGTGIGVIEAYDLDGTVDSKLANISTRGFVRTGDDVLIAGTIIVGERTQKVIARALGPSLSVPGGMANPTLELRDQNGGLLDMNDNWKDSPDKQAIIDSTIPPTNDLESAIVQVLPGNGAIYTAVLRGVNDTTGIAVVEVYALD